MHTSTLRWTILGAAVGFLAALAPACGAPKRACNATNCAGCCDSVGVCQLNNLASACGSFGQACVACGAGQVCNQGICSIPVGGTGGNGGTGGGSSFGGGTGGGSSFGGGTGGGSSFGGGTGGGSGFGGGTGGGSGFGGGTGGGSGSCSGCFVGAQCLDVSSSNRDAFCGIGGVQCADCRLSSSSCVAFHCNGSGGGTGGGFGGGSGGGGAVPPAAGESCASATPASLGISVSSTTQGMTNDVTSIATAACTGYDTLGPDAVYVTTVGIGQTLTATVTPDSTWDPAIYFVEGPASNCGPQVQQCLAGTDGNDTGVAETISYVNNGVGSQSIYIVVDGIANSSGFIGPYTLLVTVSP